MKLLKPATTAAAAAAGMSSGGSSASTSGNISSSSSHENIAQFIQGTKIIVPCLLPAAKPSHLASMWDTWGGEDMHQVGRYYTFLNAPKSCFDRLMVRFLYTMEPIVYYGSGILFRKPQNMKDSVKSSKLTAINEFRREVWLMSDLVHQNIVHMKGYSLDPYSIVMEYMDLGSLSSYLRQKRELGETLPWEIILKIAKDIAKGMAFLHNISPPLVHRDLKSPNILLATTPTEPFIVAKISDFGLSRTVVQSFVSKVVDNPTWLAPEVISQREYNEKGDIYSLGIILWELYHMQLPFEEFGIKFMSTLEDSIISGLRPTINPQCNAMYSSLITKCWNENPQSRPSFPTIVKALEEIHDNIKKTSSSSSLQNK
ncbi:hypothetical protein DFA_00688 [Cavenderia fasciculata]|uniref:Protein kinase domain-containing protein n=1 Tax=Cavenderia fasciculata TaxID=261658 RepID=F4PT87_CACFS|nr:uncharacterized protein DFA_00688 [Cavenderia fasciculata]EGG20823.1 hypothetical protein DFA_00688 [Cavenderia fasciculata]|eukprot:XP_004358673.1 hypothetical protein DFA_00688 [Cavenderia fasciculata]